jgi:hypothetical protein
LNNVEKKEATETLADAPSDVTYRVTIEPDRTGIEGLVGA